MPSIKKYTFLLIGLMILSCSDWDLERVGFTQVITIGVIDVGSNSAFLIGDIENIRESSIVESGFLLSSTANDDEGLRLDRTGVLQIPSPGLDTISEDRAFAARATGLDGLTDYYFRAYVKIEGEEQLAYGNIDVFTTHVLSLSIVDVQKTSAGCPTTAQIEVEVNGFSPGGDVQVDLVYSVGLSEIYPSIDNSVRISGGTPGPSGQLVIELPVICNENYVVRAVVVSSDSGPVYSEIFGFSTIENGDWIERAPFLGTERNNPIHFLLDQQLVMGGGDRASEIYSDYYSYDLNRDEWKSIGSFDDLEISMAAGFAINGTGYITTGRIQFENCFDVLDGQLCSDYVDTRKSLCSIVGVDFGANFTACDGATGSVLPCACYNNQLFQYTPNTQDWIAIDTFPGVERKASVVINNGKEVYIGLGYGNLPTSISPSGCDGCQITFIDNNIFSFKNDFWTYDANSNRWSQLESIPGEGRMKAVGFSIEGKVYTGLGYIVEFGLSNGPELLKRVTRFSDFYEYDPQVNSPWRVVLDFQKEPGDYNVAFSSQKHGYLLSSYESLSVPSLELWKFDPGDGSRGSWTRVDLPNDVTGIPEAAASMGNISLAYFSNSDRNFWMYIPELE